MRLDHLLSKEQLGGLFGGFRSADQIGSFAARWLLMGGTLNIGARLNGSDLVRLACGVGTVGAGRSGTCTLLGPEGPDNPALRGGGDGFFRPSPKPAVAVWVWGFWPSVENYIVDASILDSGLRSWITKGESPRGILRGVVWRIHWSISHPGLRVRVYEFDRTHVISSF